MLWNVGVHKLMESSSVNVKYTYRYLIDKREGGIEWLVKNDDRTRHWQRSVKSPGIPTKKTRTKIEHIGFGIFRGKIGISLCTNDVKPGTNSIPR